MRNLGEKITKSKLVSKLLRLISERFNTITATDEKFQDLETIALEEFVGTLKIHEDKLKIT